MISVEVDITKLRSRPQILIIDKKFKTPKFKLKIQKLNFNIMKRINLKI